MTPKCIGNAPIAPKPFAIHRALKRGEDGLPWHSHAEGQLTFAVSGMVQVVTDRGMWLVPPQLAAWVPPGVRHRLDIVTEAELWIIHLRQETIEAWDFTALSKRAFVLRVTPLLRALLADAVIADTGAAKAGLLVRLMLHELTAMDDAPTFLPVPTSDVGRRVAEIALADLRAALDVREIASRAATSVRTLSRLFPAEVGMTFKAWRQRARVIAAMEQLAEGNSPARTAHHLGFSSTAAFSHAFRQVTGSTPTAFSTTGG